jgi:hypothetical protein
MVRRYQRQRWVNTPILSIRGEDGGDAKNRCNPKATMSKNDNITDIKYLARLSL